MQRAFMLLIAWTSVANAAEWTPRNASGISALVASSAAAPPAGRPLLVVLHGCAQPNSALQQAGLAEAAEAAGGVVALPAVPGGGVFAGCWDYYGSAHTDSNRHLGPLIGFVESLIVDPTLRIDPRRVWIAGLSSGAGEALVAACVAPDLFTGVAAVGGPGLGTEAAQIAQVSTSGDAVTALCQRLSRAPNAFSTQQAVILVGTGDFIVAQGYAPVNADGFAALYGATPSRSEDLAGLPGGADGAVQFWSVGGVDRVALLTVTGLDHAWPAGRGGGATMQFVSPGGPDLGVWLFEFFGGIAPGPLPEPEPQPEPVPMPAPEDCPGASPETIEATLVEHAPRLGLHGGVYGAVDRSYVELLGLYGTMTIFPLYRGPEGWYHDATNIPAVEDCDPTPPAPPVAEPDAPPTTPPPSPDVAQPDAEPTPRGPKVIQNKRGCSAAPAQEATGMWWIGLLLGAAWRRRR